MRRRPIEERFAEKYVIDEATRCWNWTGSKVSGGYGMIRRYQSGAMPAHRFSYMHHIGEIPDGMIVRHSCNNASCVNPDHLVLGTHAENMKDLDRSGRARVLSSTDVREIVDLMGRFSQNAIARLYGVNRATIQRAIAKAKSGDLGPEVAVSDGDKQHTSLTEQQKDEIVARLRAGDRIMPLAVRFGVDRKTIRNLRPADTPSLPRGRPRKDR